MSGRYEPAKPARQTGTGLELGASGTRLNHGAAIPEILRIMVDNCGQAGGCE